MNKGLGEWKRLSQRLRGMSPRELADRLRQHTTARVDFLRHKVGFDFEPRLLAGSVQAQPNFFFSSGRVPDMCARLRQLFPKEAEEIVARAEKICAHRFDLLGYKDLHYGEEIDWHCDRVHQKRAPRKPWFQIRYLDFDQVGDSKVTWELNRHQHLVTLAKAYRLTGDEKFSSELFRQWSHWHQENPYPIGINWASSLEVAFRSLSWLWVYALMAGSAAMPNGFRFEVCRHLAISGRHIENYLSTYFSPNTHLLGEGVALFFIGTLCPELPQAQRWQRRGWAIVEQEAQRQVRADGLHFEQSTYYHVYAVDFFLYAAVLASRNGMALPAQLERTIERMLEVVCTLGRSGPPASLGDDDGGRLFDPRRNRAEYLLDPLATGAVLFGRGDFKTIAAGPREETLWLLGAEGIAEFERLPAKSLAYDSSAFQASGLYAMASGDGDSQIVIDAGPQGADTAGHGHADALSVTANTHGRRLLIDAGTYQYVGENSERDRFRGTKAHNTLVVDGLDQSEPKGPFGWGRQPRVRAEGWIKGENFDLFVGSHDGYARLADPVVHRRLVFSSKSRLWLVRDRLSGRGKHQLDLFWHIAPELSPVGISGTTFRGDGVDLAILVPENHGWSQDVLSDDWSPAYGCKERHSVLHFGTMADLPTEFVTLLIPQTEAGPSKYSLVRVAPAVAGEQVICYRFKTSEEDHGILFGQRGAWKSSGWSSDAEFLYWRQSRDRTRSVLIACNASYVEVSGGKVISSPRPFLRCEIVNVGGKVRVISSDQDTVADERVFDTISLGDFGADLPNKI